MRFAAIADVHGNYLALEAVLADIKAQGITDIVNLGDMASGPLDAKRTIDIMMGMDAPCVRGNHDRYLTDYTLDNLHKYMLGRKTECALTIFSSDTKINYPQYILDAIAK